MYQVSLGWRKTSISLLKSIYIGIPVGSLYSCVSLLYCNFLQYQCTVLASWHRAGISIFWAEAHHIISRRYRYYVLSILHFIHPRHQGNSSCSLRKSSAACSSSECSSLEAVSSLLLCSVSGSTQFFVSTWDNSLYFLRCRFVGHFQTISSGQLSRLPPELKSSHKHHLFWRFRNQWPFFLTVPYSFWLFIGYH
jgi:hypothetical protein